MRQPIAFASILVLAALASAALLWPRLRVAYRTTRAVLSEAASASTVPPPDPIARAPAEPPEVAAAANRAEPRAAPPEPPPQPPAYVRRNPESEEACPPGMVLVDGVYCPFVGHRCTSYLLEERDVCQSYAPEVICEGALRRLRFCIDVYEYPNVEGVRPVVMVDFNDAERACRVEGKRLCDVDEWQFACEGPDMWPYPYGIERDPTACNIDRPYPLPDLAAFSDAWRISEEVERLDQRVASGAMPRCVSPFGVHDMTGNVDEWVVRKDGKRFEKPYRSTLKGGYWGPIRARCRPVTSTHNEWFSFYQVGFRCCADAKPPKTPRPRTPLGVGRGLRPIGGLLPTR